MITSKPKSSELGDNQGEEDISAHGNPAHYDNSDMNRPFTGEEVTKAIKDLKSNKAPGIDKIINEYIKATIGQMLPIYVYLFNKILDTGEIPQEWLIGKIMPLYKGKGDIKEAGNYRGITILNCLGKLFTSMLNRRLTKFLEQNNILHENQAGFRKGYRTVDHIIIFVFKCLIDIFCANRRKLFCAFADYKKAFDTVWREGLWVKLIHQGISGKIFNVIRSIYSNIKSCVFAKGEQSEYFVSNVGMRQGKNLSPLLFSLYVNDLEVFLQQNGCNCINLNIDICERYLKLLVLMYTDDTILFANNVEGLQNVLDNLEKYCTKWKLKVNCHKTTVTVFGRLRVNKSKLKFMYNQSRREIVDCFKYLGVNFQFNGNFSRWKKDLSDQGVRPMYSILSKGRALNLSLDIMLDLFDKMICPVLLYASEVWGPGNNAVIERVHLMFCKYILGLKRSTPNCIVYRELERYPVDIKIKTSIIAYRSRVVNN